jgi:hypothetical protein
MKQLTTECKYSRLGCKHINIIGDDEDHLADCDYAICRECKMPLDDDISGHTASSCETIRKLKRKHEEEIEENKRLKVKLACAQLESVHFFGLIKCDNVRNFEWTPGINTIKMVAKNYLDSDMLRRLSVGDIKIDFDLGRSGVGSDYEYGNTRIYTNANTGTLIMKVSFTQYKRIIGKFNQSLQLTNRVGFNQSNKLTNFSKILHCFFLNR